jgi:hypothetical protein
LVSDLVLVSEYKVSDLLPHPVHLHLCLQVEEIEVSTLELHKILLIVILTKQDLFEFHELLLLLLLSPPLFTYLALDILLDDPLDHLVDLLVFVEIQCHSEVILLEFEAIRLPAV